MVEPSPPGDSADDDDATPRWVYVSGIIALIVLVVIVVLHLTGHGLGDHVAP